MQESQSGEFGKPEIRGSAYSGTATKPALVNVIGLFAEASISGARPKAARASLMVKMPFDVEPERTQPLSRRAAPARHRRVVQHRKRESERTQAHSSCPARAHMALTIACMSTPPRGGDLRNLT